MGVSAFFFLPALVAALTSADEFHSVWKTGCPAALSHFARSASCVVLPEPSMPSTTKSFPGYSCGVVSVFSMGGSARDRRADFDTQRFADQPFKFCRVPAGSPQLELRVARGAELQQTII